MGAFREDDKRMLANVTIPASGHVIATVTAAPQTIALKPEVFTEYLKEEGLTAIIEARAQRGEAEKEGKERYSMYAKAILLADSPSDAWKQTVGSPIEFVAQKDPYQLKSGDSLPVKLLVRGAPASGLEVKAASATPAGNKIVTVGRTDAEGNISVPVIAGRWRLHAIHMERAKDTEVDWESYWGTLTFEIR
jgi:uncharacterized GH25 family protein